MHYKYRNLNINILTYNKPSKIEGFTFFSLDNFYYICIIKK